ncbi:MAG: aminotransferase class V-fold PLP-dependent enzyme [Firmicutes bacterium]|nr:aminotransferase class V-fold PLP-dependent enzyme [Bacillota bacterium]
MRTYPLHSIDVEQAKQLQFKLVDVIHRNFSGEEFLQAGDYGVVPGLGKPQQTVKVEKVLADFFDCEAAILVRGAGTGAIRNVFHAVVKPNQRIIVHQAPVYPSTKVIIHSMGLKQVPLDFNDINSFDEELIKSSDFALIQYSRQQLNDSYNMKIVIDRLKAINKDIIILTDDNYVAMKTAKIGAQLGADVSAFSLFKLLGPEGIGCVVGSRRIINRIKELNYSGGSQVQGAEAMEALRALVYAPVALAIQAEEGNKIVDRLKSGEVSGVKTAYIANAQSRVILVEFERPVAKKVLQNCNQLGGAPHPVGAESKYEVTAMFYRVSGTFLEKDPGLADRMIRINPMRAGADTVIRVLSEALEQLGVC